jgi:DNA transposition AAA+ family ATPase
MKYPTDPTVIAELQKLRNELKLSNKGLTEKLAMDGVTETFISKYLNDKLDRLVPNFEARFRDILKGIRERIAFGSEIFETSVTRKMRNGFDLIRATGQIALVTSPAGNGKTSGVNAFLASNPSAVGITLNATTRNAPKVLSLMFNAVDHQGWKPGTSRFDFLVERFLAVSRFLIVDNAQRLDGSGRQLLFDFHDAAKSPIALVGNPELLGRIQSNDQQGSRIGINPSYELQEAELPAAAKRVAQQFSDLDTAEQIEDLVAFIASQEGRLRAVQQAVTTMQQLRCASAKLKDDPRAALRSASSILAVNYKLPSD